MAVESFLDYDMTFRILPKESIDEVEKECKKMEKFREDTKEIVATFDRNIYDPIFQKYHDVFTGNKEKLKKAEDDLIEARDKV